MYFALTGTVETLHNMNAIVFTSYLAMHSTNTLYLQLTEDKEGPKGEGAVIWPFFPSFYVLSSSLPFPTFGEGHHPKPGCPPGFLGWLSREKAGVCPELQDA